ncbi:MAG: hypothetical protein WAO76_09760 [Georgfuchsia sp.]
MDSKSIFSKTAKGLREVSGESSNLPRPLRAILKEIDGKRTFSILQQRLQKHSEAQLRQMLENLETDGYIRNTSQVIHTTVSSLSPPPVKEDVQGDFSDLDFTAMATKPALSAPHPSRPVADREALRRAQVTKIEAEARARKEAEEKARREAEERARKEAEEKSRREAEEKQKREAEEKSRREAEEKQKREAEEKARREAEARAKIEAEARARKEAEEKARREAEERARKEAEEKSRREAEEKQKREAEVKVARISERAISLAQIRWPRLIKQLSLPLATIILVAIHIVPFNGLIPGLEKVTGEQFQQPVKIDGLHLSLFPQPHWRLDGVSVGSEGQIKAPQVKAVIDLGEVFGKGMAYKSIEFESPLLKEQAVGWLLLGRPQGQAIRIAHIRVNDAAFESENIDLLHFDANADIGADGNWQKVVLEFSNKDIYVELHPDADRVQFEINANKFLSPLGGSLQFDDFMAKGTFGSKDMRITKFEGRNFGGFFHGNAILNWAGDWSIDGSVNAKQVDTKKLVPALLGAGIVDGSATYAMRAKNARTLFVTPHLEGSFVVGQGELLGVDLMHLLQHTEDSGKTGFRSLEGAFVCNGDIMQLQQLRLDAGIISAGGSAEINASAKLRGSLAATYRFGNQQAHASIRLTGTVGAPKFSR